MQPYSRRNFHRKNRIADFAEARHTGGMDIAENLWGKSLWNTGYARLGTLLEGRECEDIRGLYDQAEMFSSRIDMARYRFGRVEYQYFAYPLPPRIDQLRHELYAQLNPIATEWMAALRSPKEYPPAL